MLILLEKLYEAGAGAWAITTNVALSRLEKDHSEEMKIPNPHLGKPMIREEVEEVQLNLVFQKHLEQKYCKPF